MVTVAFLLTLSAFFIVLVSLYSKLPSLSLPSAIPLPSFSTSMGPFELLSAKTSLFVDNSVVNTNITARNMFKILFLTFIFISSFLFVCNNTLTSITVL